MIDHVLYLDMRKNKRRVPPSLTMRRGESQTQTIAAALSNNGAPYAPACDSARLCILHADGTWARVSATVESASVSATLPSEALNGVGRCRLAYFELIAQDGSRETTENFELVILGNVDGTTDPAKSYDNKLDALYEKLSECGTALEKSEQARATAEQARAKAEADRETAEADRDTAEQARAKAEADRETAEQARETASAKAVEDCDAAADDAREAADQARAAAAVPQYDEATGRYDNASIAAWLSRMRDGKAYGVSVPKGLATSCTKTGANAGIANPVPGVIGQPAVDPYAGKGAFLFFEVNGGVDADGAPYVTAIDGDGRFSRLEDTYVMAPVLYVSETETGDAVRMSVSDTRLSGMDPQPGAVLPSGDARPYMLYAKYALSVDADGNPRSASGRPVKRFVSHDSGVTLCKTASTGYSFRSAADDWYVKQMFLLKYATKNSQSVFAGCSSHSEQVAATAATSNACAVTVAATSAAAKSWPVGSWVMVGSSASTSVDRGTNTAHDLVEAARITAKATSGDDCVITLDSPAFSCDAGAVVSTCPWGTGACDAVEGDGSPTSCTGGREPFVLQGIELGLGMYEVLGNVLLNSAGEGWSVYVNPDTRDEKKGSSPDTALCAGAFPGAADKDQWNYGLYPRTAGGLMAQQGTGASTSTGICDGNYKNNDAATGWREWLSLGYLGIGGNAGLWCVYGSIGTGNAWWRIGSRLSVTGRGRGEAA